MPRIEPFEQYTGEYERWFRKHILVYESEVQALRQLLPPFNRAVEIGVGSGRFARPLGIPIGLEPSRQMANLARRRGISVQIGIAEALPYRSEAFDLVLLVTTICFLDDLPAALQEIHRILRPHTHLLIGFIDRESEIGRIYQKFKQQNVFYRVATFFSVPEVERALTRAGFGHFRYSQTIFHPLDKICRVEPARSGYGEGSFVGILAQKI